MTDYRLTDARISRWIDEESAGGFPVDLLEATFDRTRAMPRRSGSAASRILPTPRSLPAMTAVGVALIMVAASALLLPSQETLDVNASARPLGSHGSASVRPLPSLPPLGPTLDSPLNHFSIQYPDGWNVTPARWIQPFAEWSDDVEHFDTLRSPDGTYSLRVSSTRLWPGDTGEWIVNDRIAPPAGRCFPPVELLPAVTIAGWTGRINDICDVVQATVVAGDRLYLFALRVPRDAGATDGRRAFDELMATVQLDPPLDTRGWTPYMSSQYGSRLAYPAGWTAEPASRFWTLGPDARDPQSTAMDSFTSPDGLVRASVWSIARPEAARIRTWSELATWVEGYCQQTGNDPCSDIVDRAVPMCLGHRECQPALIVPFDGDAQAFITDGVGTRMTVVAAWQKESDPAVFAYGGPSHLVEGFLSTMNVWRPTGPDNHP